MIWRISSIPGSSPRLDLISLVEISQIDLPGSPVCSSSKHLSSKARHCLRLRKIGKNIHLWCVWQNCGGVLLIWSLSPYDGSIKLTDFQCQHCWNKVLISPNEMCILNWCKLWKSYIFHWEMAPHKHNVGAIIQWCHVEWLCKIFTDILLSWQTFTFWLRPKNYLGFYHFEKLWFDILNW